MHINTLKHARTGATKRSKRFHLSIFTSLTRHGTQRGAALGGGSVLFQFLCVLCVAFVCARAPTTCANTHTSNINPDNTQRKSWCRQRKTSTRRQPRRQHYTIYYMYTSSAYERGRTQFRTRAPAPHFSVFAQMPWRRRRQRRPYDSPPHRPRVACASVR